MTDLSQMSPSEMIAEAERRTVRRRAGLPLEDESPRTAAYVQVIEGSFRGMRKVTLPWSVLVPDNERARPTTRAGAFGHRTPLLALTTRYKKAKGEARKLLKTDCGGLLPLSGRISIEATLYEPNASRTRDVSNYAKLVHDAMSGIVYTDDGQIDDLHWRRGLPDIDRPRLELTVTEIRP